MRSRVSLKPITTWWWGVPDQDNDNEASVDDDKTNSPQDYTKSQPAERFENIPEENEEGEFDEDVRNVTEPVRKKA